METKPAEKEKGENKLISFYFIFLLSIVCYISLFCVNLKLDVNSSLS